MIMSSMHAWDSLNTRWILALVILSLVTVVSPASAVTILEQAKEKKAKKLCLTSDFEKGIELLAELYTDTNELTYLYNQGRCYQQNGRPEQALNRFREYLRKGPKQSAIERAELDTNMRECQMLIDQPNLVPVITGPPHRTASAEKMRASPSTEIPALVTNSPPPASPKNDGRGLKIAGIITTGVGVIAVGTGVGFGLAHNRLISNYTRDKQSKINDYKTLTWVAYGVGAASITAGVILYIFGWEAGKVEPMKVAFIPAILPGEATMNLRGFF